MSNLLLSANETLKGYHGGEIFFRHQLGKFIYSEGVQEIAKKHGVYWLLDIIASYQPKLKNEDFQVWKLQRDCKILTVNDIKTVTERTDSFLVVCEDGNDNILIKQEIEFSDFPFDTYTLWFQNETLYLPVEH